MIMSRQGAAGSPQKVPKELLETKMKFKVAKKSSTEALKSSENDLKIKNVNVHKTIEKQLKIIDFSGPESELGAQICIEKARGIRF